MGPHQGRPGFVGLQNFQEVLADANFWNAMLNTFGIFVVATVPQLLLALMLANWLNRKLRFRTALRMGILLPNITSVAAVGIVFGFIFADRYGLANWVLQSLSLDRSPGGAAAGPPGPRSRSWSTGGGPATTR